MEVICISGKAQHGKDTTAVLLKNELVSAGHAAVIMHYADLLKFICKSYFDWDGVKDEKGRTLLQYIGTDVVRKKQPSFWCDFMVNLLRLFECEWDYVIIADCRFPNEIDEIRVAGFEVTHVRVVRPYFDNGLSEEQKGHISEVALDDYPVNIYIGNNSDLFALSNKVKALLEIITPRKSRRYVKSDDLCYRCAKRACPNVIKNTPCEFENKEIVRMQEGEYVCL